MGTQVSFQQILEEKLQAKSHKNLSGQSIEQTSQTLDPAHLAYLMGHLGPAFFRPQTHKIYPARPKPPLPPHSLSGEQGQARDFFLLQGVELSPAFSQRELKKAFRSLALRLHPDTNKGAPEDAFIRLKTNYEILLTLFN